MGGVGRRPAPRLRSVTSVSSETATRLVLPLPEVAGRLPDAFIDLLAPFLPLEEVGDGVLGELEDYFGGLVPFEFVLGDPARFPSGAAYLPPQPVTALRRVVHGLRHLFPEVVQPNSSFDAVVPHLPLPEEAVVVTPLEVHARAAQLLRGDGTVLAEFPFGTSAA